MAGAARLDSPPSGRDGQPTRELRSSDAQRAPLPSGLRALLLALAVAAFSLRPRPLPLSSTLAPDAFEGRRGTGRTAQPRRPLPRPPARQRRRPAPRRAYRRDAQGLGGRGGFSVRSYQLEGQTIDGEQTLSTVVARRAGSTSASPILILAHRDAARPGLRRGTVGHRRAAGAGARVRRTGDQAHDHPRLDQRRQRRRRGGGAAALGSWPGGPAGAPRRGDRPRRPRGRHAHAAARDPVLRRRSAPPRCSSSARSPTRSPRRPASTRVRPARSASSSIWLPAGARRTGRARRAGRARPCSSRSPVNGGRRRRAGAAGNGCGASAARCSAPSTPRHRSRRLPGDADRTDVAAPDGARVGAAAARDHAAAAAADHRR